MAMFYYDGQIRKYLVQLIRMLSGFRYRTGDGLTHSIPVMLGDMSRQAAHVLNNNSGNSVQSVPRIALYVNSIELNRDLLSDPTYISSVHIRERAISTDNKYENRQGDGFTIERLNPTPYKLSVRADIWSSNTEQKLQILEQILPLFNPSLDIQTTSNFVDWTSLTTVMLIDTTFSSRSIPAGADDQDDYATLTFELPIWLSLPAKVKNLGIIQRVITNILDGSTTLDDGYIVGEPYDTVVTTIGDYDILVDDDEISLLTPRSHVDENPNESVTPFSLHGNTVNWMALLDLYPARFRDGISQIILIRPSGLEIVGTMKIQPHSVKMAVEWDIDTLPSNNLIVSPVFEAGKGTITAIIDPLSHKPLKLIPRGTRYMLVGDIGYEGNTAGAAAWRGLDGSNLTAVENDIIEWDGTKWNVIFPSRLVTDEVYITNLKTNTQYRFFEGKWVKSVDGEYMAGSWRLVL